MKTLNYVLIATLSSLAYYFGYKQDVLFFQIVTWAILIASLGLYVFGFIGLQLLDYKKEGQELKKKMPPKIQYVLGIPITILNGWIFYGNQIFYLYCFITILAYVFLFKTKQKFKEHNLN